MILNCIKCLESVESGANSPSAQTIRDRLNLEGMWLEYFNKTSLGHFKMVKVGEGYRAWLKTELKKAMLISPRAIVLADRGIFCVVTSFLIFTLL